VNVPGMVVSNLGVSQGDIADAVGDIAGQATHAFGDEYLVTGDLASATMRPMIMAISFLAKAAGKAAELVAAEAMMTDKVHSLLLGLLHKWLL
jgi:hypothetical protein